MKLASETQFTMTDTSYSDSIANEIRRDFLNLCVPIVGDSQVKVRVLVEMETA